MDLRPRVMLYAGDACVNRASGVERRNTNMASLLSAAAASLAAALAGINLYVLGRRERHRWLRETLVDEYATYLNASFSATHEAREYAKSSSEASDSENRAAVDRQIQELHSQQMDTLTRLRLLATADVVYAAGQVHAADHAVIDLLSSSDSSPTASYLQDTRENAYARREDFIRAARKSMKIPGTVAKVERV